MDKEKITDALIAAKDLLFTLYESNLIPEDMGDEFGRTINLIIDAAMSID